MVGGKIMLGVLGASLFAKAAVTVPDMSFLSTILDSPPDQLILAAGEEEKKDMPEPEEDAPELVSGLEKEPQMDVVPEELLQSMKRERELLEQQKLELEKERAKVALAREALSIEKGSLMDLRDEIGGLLDRVDAAKTDDLDRLVSFYTGMKPAEAALIMDDMDIETTIMIMGTMKPRSAAPILAKMAPVRARAISKIILERSQLPADQDLVGIRLN